MIAVEGDFEVGFCWDFERGKRESAEAEREDDYTRTLLHLRQGDWQQMGCLP